MRAFINSIFSSRSRSSSSISLSSTPVSVSPRTIICDNFTLRACVVMSRFSNELMALELREAYDF